MEAAKAERKLAEESLKIEEQKLEQSKEQFEKWIGHAVSELEKYNGELPTTRKVYCIEEDKIYDSAMTLAKEWGIKNNGYIYNVCNHKKSYKTVKGKHLLWLDEYLKIKVN